MQKDANSIGIKKRNRVYINLKKRSGQCECNYSKSDSYIHILFEIKNTFGKLNCTRLII